MNEKEFLDRFGFTLDIKNRESKTFEKSVPEGVFKKNNRLVCGDMIGFFGNHDLTKLTQEKLETESILKGAETIIQFFHQQEKSAIDSCQLMDYSSTNLTAFIPILIVFSRNEEWFKKELAFQKENDNRVPFVAYRIFSTQTNFFGKVHESEKVQNYAILIKLFELKFPKLESVLRQWLFEKLKANVSFIDSDNRLDLTLLIAYKADVWRTFASSETINQIGLIEERDGYFKLANKNCRVQAKLNLQDGAFRYLLKALFILFEQETLSFKEFKEIAYFFLPTKKEIEVNELALYLLNLWKIGQEEIEKTKTKNDARHLVISNIISRVKVNKVDLINNVDIYIANQLLKNEQMQETVKFSQHLYSKKGRLIFSMKHIGKVPKNKLLFEYMRNIVVQELLTKKYHFSVSRLFAATDEILFEKMCREIIYEKQDIFDLFNFLEREDKVKLLATLIIFYKSEIKENMEILALGAFYLPKLYLPLCREYLKK